MDTSSKIVVNTNKWLVSIQHTLFVTTHFGSKRNRVLFKKKVNIDNNKERMNCVHEIKRKLKCMDEIKRKRWTIVQK